MQCVRSFALLLLWHCSGTAIAQVRLVAYWPLDEHLKDLSSEGNQEDNGTFVGNSSFGKGAFGQAIVLDGSNFVTIPTSPDLEFTDEDLTVSVWIRIDKWEKRSEAVIGKGRRREFHLGRFTIDEQWLGYGGGGSTALGELSGGPVNDGRWHHIVCVTKAGRYSRIFIDGQLKKSGGPETANLKDTGQVLMLGNNPNSRYDVRWVGAIDEVGLFATALTSGEVRAIHRLAVQPAFRYDLKTLSRLVSFYRKQSPATLKLGNHSWKYTAKKPNDDSVYVPLAEDGSGLTTSLLPGVISLNTSARFLSTGESAELRWRVSDDIESLHLSGLKNNLEKTDTSLTVTPAETTTYTLTAFNKHGKSTASVTMFVDYEFSTPTLTEFVADSDGTLRDEDDEPSDWIELTNTTAKIASTRDLYLTDDFNNLRKWEVPEMLLEPGESRLIFASGKDRRNPDGELHTNFKLSNKGEFLALVQSRGESEQLVASFGTKYPKLARGISYGVGAKGKVGPLLSPTPNGANTEVADGTVKQVQFDVTRGFYDAPFDLSLTSKTEGAKILFTTDGTIPSLTNGEAFLKPIRITTTTVVRAAAFQRGKRDSKVTTHSFLFPGDIVKQSATPSGFPIKWETLPADYEMDPRVTNNPAYHSDLLKGLQEIPSLVLSLPPEELFGLNGIYTNPLDSGRAWERATSMEFLPGDNREGFQIDCGLRIYGGFGRNRAFKKHSMRVLFKRKYGKSKLKYSFFTSTDATSSFDTLTLRAGFNNSWQTGGSRAQYLRDEFMRRSQRDMGHLASHGRFVHVYLNGLYWGVYNVVERPTASFAASYLGGEKEDFDALNSGEAVDGTTETWQQTHQIARESNSENIIENLSPWLDFDNLIDYMLLNFYGGNQDWDGHNWYAARRKDTGASWHFFSWDAERSLENARGDNKTDTNHGNNPSYLFNRLLEHPEFRQRVLERSRLHFFNGGALTPERAAARYKQMSDELHNAIIAESARWGDARQELPYTRDESWLPERDRLMQSWFPVRTQVVLNQLNDFRNLGYVRPPMLRPEGDSLEIVAKIGKVYYTTDGRDPRSPDGSPHPQAKMLEGFSGNSVFLPKQSEWRYLDDGSDQGTEWRGVGFDDSQWKTGRARLGYGGDGEQTRIGYGQDSSNKFITTYFRREFTMPPEASYDFLQMQLCRDDGAIVYLNGREVVRSNLPERGKITFQTTAALSQDEQLFYEYEIDRKLLKEGKNLIAVELHQSSRESSDAGMDLSIRGVKYNRVSLSTGEGNTIKARTYLDGVWSDLVGNPDSL